MSSNATSKSLTVPQRGAEATRRLRAILGIDEVTPAALKLLSTAVAQVSVTEAEANDVFARRLKETYQELVDASTTPKTMRKRRQLVDLEPIGIVDMSSYDPYGPPDPYFLVKLYGHHQLAAALSQYKLPQLKQALAIVEGRNPDTKPTSRAKADAIIEYIVHHVAG